MAGKVRPIPEGLHAITPSLTVDGAAEAMELYKKAFNATELSRAPDPSGKKIWHGSMKIANSTFFINDAFPDMGGGANVTRLWLYCDDVDMAWKRAVDAGLKAKMPLAEMFWGDKMGTLVDKWGNEWSLAQRVKDMTPDEMKKAGEEFAKSMAKKK